MAKKKKDKPPRHICPACGKRAGIEILRGYPTPEGEAMAERGEVLIGGCLIGENDPDFACEACEHEWSRG